MKKEGVVAVASFYVFLFVVVAVFSFLLLRDVRAQNPPDATTASTSRDGQDQEVLLLTLPPEVFDIRSFRRTTSAGYLLQVYGCPTIHFAEEWIHCDVGAIYHLPFVPEHSIMPLRLDVPSLALSLHEWNTVVTLERSGTLPGGAPRTWGAAWGRIGASWKLIQPYTEVSP